MQSFSRKVEVAVSLLNDFPAPWLGALGRISVQTSILLALFHLLHVTRMFARRGLVCCNLPMVTIVVLLNARYRAIEAETASFHLPSAVSHLGNRTSHNGPRKPA